MAEILKVFDENDNVVGEAKRNDEGKTEITIKDLKPGTTYKKGTFKVAYENDGVVSELIDVPEFKTKASRRKAKAQK